MMPLAAEYNIIRQLVPVSLPIVGKMMLQRPADLGDDGRDTLRIIGIIEMRKDRLYLLVPERYPNFFVNASIAEKRQLTVFQRHIDQDAIAGFRFFHPQPAKNLGRPVQGIDIPATPFDEYTDFTASALFCGLDGRNDLVLLLFIEQRFAFEKGHII